MKHTTIPHRDEIGPDTPLRLSMAAVLAGSLSAHEATRCDALDRPLRRAADPASGIVGGRGRYVRRYFRKQVHELVRDRRMPTPSALTAGRCGIFAI